MPSRRAASIVLAAAVLTGATAGVSAALANVRVPGLYAASPNGSPGTTPSQSPSHPTDPSKTPSTPPTTPSTPAATSSGPPPAVPNPGSEPTKASTPDPEPTVEETPEIQPVAPTEFVEVDFSAPPPPGSETGGSASRAEVPKGWTVVNRGTQWRDFLDPTGTLNLRINGSGVTASGPTQSVEDAANQARAERAKAKGFKQLGWKIFPYATQGGTEFGEGIEFRFSYAGSKGTRYGVERFFLDGRVMAGAYAWKGQLELVEPALDRAIRTYQYGGD
jgi:hypothetical protein